MTFLFTIQWGAGQLGELSRLIEEMISHGAAESRGDAQHDAKQDNTGPLSVCETHWCHRVFPSPLKFRTSGFP